MLRRRLKKGPSAVSEDTLIALWCAIDADDSDQVYPQEFGAFLRRGAADFKSKAPDNLNKRNIELGGAQTAGLGRALESTPTAEMRAKLEAPLNEDQMLVWAKQFCKWLEMSLYKKNLSVHTWFNLFSEIDEDGSGFVTFDEFEDVVRHRLGQSVKKVPDETVRAIWCALDTDDSNQIMPQEMGKWLKQGADEVTSKAPKNLNKKKIELGGAQTAGLGRALESTPTAEMRASLQAPLTEDQMLELSKHFNEWLEASIYASNRSTHSWFNLFKEIDEDGSGYITFDEFEDVIRHKLKQPKKVISDERVKAIWCALDADDSNQIMPQEMGKWLKQGAIEKKAKLAPSSIKKIELGGLHTAGIGRALASTPTAEMRAKLEAGGVGALTKEDLHALSKSFNERLEQSAYNKNKNTHSWFSL